MQPGQGGSASPHPRAERARAEPRSYRTKRDTASVRASYTSSVVRRPDDQPRNVASSTDSATRMVLTAISGSIPLNASRYTSVVVDFSPSSTVVANGSSDTSNRDTSFAI